MVFEHLKIGPQYSDSALLDLPEQLRRCIVFDFWGFINKLPPQVSNVRKYGLLVSVRRIVTE